MRKTVRISAFVVLMILFHIAILVSAGQSVRKYSWGSMQVLTQGIDAVTIRLQLIPQNFNAVPAVLSQRVLYFALSPSKQIKSSVTGFVAAPGPFKNVYRVLADRTKRDSSTVKQTLEAIPIEHLPSSPNAAVVGYGWYRGYYIARIEITPFYGHSINAYSVVCPIHRYTA